MTADISPSSPVHTTCLYIYVHIYISVCICLYIYVQIYTMYTYIYPPAPMNRVKIFKGWTPRDAPSKLVQRWYKSLPPDHGG